MNKSHEKILKLTQVAFLSALIVVLQIISYFIKLGPFNLSVVLVPIVVGGFILGPKYGAVLGGVFGVVVTAVSAMGLDSGGVILFGVNPLLCTFTCILKGVLAGFVPALVYSAIAVRNKNARIPVMFLSAALAPIMNTATFCACMALFFRETLTAWAGGTDVMFYMITGLVGLNFIFEFILNLLLCPIIGATVVFATRRRVK